MKLALAGDTMLGRLVGERLAQAPARALVAPEVVAVAHEADLFVLNLECAISDRGEPWPDPYKPFFFRAPPAALEVLTLLGVDCVTLANNHALDYGTTALLDTLRHLREAGIAWVGAGPDEDAARAPAVLEHAGRAVTVIGVTDHPADFSAGPGRPGVAFADLKHGQPGWLLDLIAAAGAATLVTPHWGPNMVPEPVRHVRAAAAAFRSAGATLIAGHSAHVFHGVSGGVLFDLGDFLDDYATHPVLRNDLGLLFLVTLDAGAGGLRPVLVEAIPLALDFCHTRLADPHEAGWITDRFRQACADLGTQVEVRDGRLRIDWS